MSFSKKILVGLLTGVAAGIVLGDYVAPLALVADGFVRLLQMTMLPYVTVSIVLSVGSLDAAQAKRLGLRATPPRKPGSAKVCSSRCCRWSRR